MPDRWENHIDFTITDGGFKAEVEEFKNYLRYAEPLDSYDKVHTSDIQQKLSMVQRFKAWLWSKGIMTIRRR